MIRRFYDELAGHWRIFLVGGVLSGVAVLAVLAVFAGRGSGSAGPAFGENTEEARPYRALGLPAQQSGRGGDPTALVGAVALYSAVETRGELYGYSFVLGSVLDSWPASRDCIVVMHEAAVSDGRKAVEEAGADLNEQAALVTQRTAAGALRCVDNDMVKYGAGKEEAERDRPLDLGVMPDSPRLAMAVDDFHEVTVSALDPSSWVPQDANRFADCREAYRRNAWDQGVEGETVWPRDLALHWKGLTERMLSCVNSRHPDRVLTPAVTGIYPTPYPTLSR